MKYIDLRSDTVTLPTKQMRDAIYNAQVGDDVYGEDPSINRLEEMAAQMLGKEAALFVTSGTQGNQICVMTHTQPGDEVILEEKSHHNLRGWWHRKAGRCAGQAHSRKTWHNGPSRHRSCYT